MEKWPNEFEKRRNPRRSAASTGARKRHKQACSRTELVHCTEAELEAWVSENSRCAYCGSEESIQIDHIVPLSRGGAHAIENLQPLCRTCNTVKWNLTEDELFRHIQKMTRPTR